eukprot:CFRG6110T1
MRATLAFYLIVIARVTNAQFPLPAVFLQYAQADGTCLSNSASTSNTISWITCSTGTRYNYAEYSFNQALVVSTIGSCVTLPNSVGEFLNSTDSFVTLAPCLTEQPNQRFAYLHNNLLSETNPAQFPFLSSSAYTSNGVSLVVCVVPCRNDITKACAIDATLLNNEAGTTVCANTGLPVNSALTPEFVSIIPTYGSTTTSTTYFRTAFTTAVAPQTVFINEASTIFIATSTQFGGTAFTTDTTTSQQVFTISTEVTQDVTVTTIVTEVIGQNTTVLIGNDVELTTVQSTTAESTATTSVFNPFASFTQASSSDPFATSSATPFNPFETFTTFNPFATARFVVPEVRSNDADGGVGAFYRSANDEMRAEDYNRNHFSDEYQDPMEALHRPQYSELVQASFDYKNVSAGDGHLSKACLVVIVIVVVVIIILCLISITVIARHVYIKKSKGGHDEKGQFGDSDTITSDVAAVGMTEPPEQKNASLGYGSEIDSGMSIPSTFVV